jgi:hypothetical protein
MSKNSIYIATKRTHKILAKITVFIINRLLGLTKDLWIVHSVEGKSNLS